MNADRGPELGVAEAGRTPNAVFVRNAVHKIDDKLDFVQERNPEGPKVWIL